MEKVYLLPRTPRYKANLHCHTTLSDGRLSPEEIKSAYKRRGYSVVAFTDHEYIVNHQDMNDEAFIAVTAYEYSINESYPGEKRTFNDIKCCHLNLYAKDPFEDKHVCFSPKYVWGPGSKVADKLKYSGELHDRSYDNIQEIIDAANANGYLVCFNHPYWSLQPQKDYFDLTGLFAMEVYNSGCGIISGNSWYDYGLFCETHPDAAPVAADDNHNPNGDVENSDSFGGYTMLCTDDFTYKGIINALESRSFYASTGIEFSEISLCDGKVHVECSECTDIMAYFGGRRWTRSSSSEGITKADFSVPADAKYIRIFCVDKRNGSMATTKPYTVD